MVKKAVKVKKTSSQTRKKTAKSTEFSKLEHFLVPEHIKLTQKEKEELFQKYNITLKELPKIFINDAAIRHLDVKENDVIKIVRKSPTGGVVVFYRGVINE